MGDGGFEPPTSTTSMWRPACLADRTGRSSLLYILVDPRGLEPLTSSTSRMRSSQLSYGSRYELIARTPNERHYSIKNRGNTQYSLVSCLYNYKSYYVSMRPVTQLEAFGCGAACVAFLLHQSYSSVITLLGRENAQTKGCGCQKLCNALSTRSRKYRYKKYKPKFNELLDQDGVIVFIKRSTSYPAGHYLCRRDRLWMDPWMNLRSSKNLAEAYSGFRRTLPGEPEFIIYPDPETSSG